MIVHHTDPGNTVGRDGKMLTNSQIYGAPRIDTGLGLFRENSSTPANGTAPDISKGKFTLCKALNRREEDGKIYSMLSRWLRGRVTHKSRVRLIDDAVDTDTVARRKAMIAKVEAINEFCGRGMDPAFINFSVATRDPIPHEFIGRSNGVLLWEEGEAVVGIITYYYSDDGDVYIDGLCINQTQAYRGGGQLLKWFVDCLSANFKKFSLSSIIGSVPFYERNGFTKKEGGEVDGLQPMYLISNKTHTTKVNKMPASSMTMKKMLTRSTPASRSSRSSRPMTATKAYRSNYNIVGHSRRRSRWGGSAGNRMRRDNAGAIMPQYKNPPIVKLKTKRRTHKRTNYSTRL